MNPHKETGEEPRKEYWITPPELYKKLNDEFHFDYDPCPYPYAGVDGTETEWGQVTYLNPPFRKADGQNGKGPTAFMRKAIEENKKGKTVVAIINTNAFINMMVEAGAELRSMGRVKWLDGKTGEPWKSPSCTTLFILKGKNHKKEDALAQALKDAREEAYQAGIRRALEITERVQSDPPSTSFEATEAFIGACDEIEFALDAELHGNK